MSNQLEDWVYTYDHDPSYMVSNFGRVRGKDGRILKQYLRGDHNKKYYCITMYYDSGKQKHTKIHHLVIYYFSKDQDTMADFFFDPLYEIDHIDTNPFNNHISNLRFATKSQNSHNRKSVGYSKHYDKFQSKIMVNGKHIHLGRFKNQEYAQQAYQIASIKYFGEFSPFYKTGIMKIKPKYRKISQ